MAHTPNPEDHPIDNEITEEQRQRLMDEIGASGNNGQELANSPLGTLGSRMQMAEQLYPKQEIDPAMAAFLYFSNMGRAAGRPGATLLSSFAEGFEDPAKYLMQTKKSNQAMELAKAKAVLGTGSSTGVAGSRPFKVLAAWKNGLVQYLTKDGQMVVKQFNKEYTDPVQIKKLIDTANQDSYRVDLETGTVEAEIAGLKKGKEGAFEIAKSQMAEAQKAIPRLVGNIQNYKEGIAAINDGAQSGFFMRMLPSMRTASIQLDNVVNRLGLDVVGSVTFGALSAGELSMAMSTAAPTSFAPEYLKKWFENRIKAKENLLKVSEDIARFLSDGEKTMADYYERKDRLQQNGEWRATLGLDDVDEQYADSDIDQDNQASSFSVDQINAMNKADLLAVDITTLNRAAKQAYIEKARELLQ